MQMKKIKKASSLLLVSVATVLGLMVTGYAKEENKPLITVEVTNNSPFNIWVKKVEAVSLVSGNVEARWKEDFKVPEMFPLAPGRSETSNWNFYWAPGIKQIEWQGVGGMYAGSSGKSENYNATGVTLDLSKATSPNDKVEVNFELSKDKSGQDQAIPFKYKEADFTLHVMVKATPVVWKGDLWNEIYYSYEVQIK